jgi:hypothetical protein
MTRVATVAAVSLPRGDGVLGQALVLSWAHDEALTRRGPGAYRPCGPDGGNRC